MSASRQRSTDLGDPLGKAAVAVWTAVWLLAVVLLSRKTAGALTESLSPAAACLAATVASLASLAALVLFCRSRQMRPSAIAQKTVGTIALLPPLAISGVLVPGGSPFCIAYFAGTSVLTVTAAVILLHESTPRLRAPEFTSLGAQDKRWPAPFEVPPARGDVARQRVTQSIRRHSDSAGGECVEGSLQATFAAGQKHAALHVPFSPPLCGVPRIECEPVDAPQVRVKVAAVHTYGARLEARRSGPLDEPLTVELGFAAVVSAADRKAA